MKRGLIIFTSFLFLIFALNFTSAVDAKSSLDFQTCNDGTFYNTCSLTKPYFCYGGTLVPSSESCGCPDKFTKKENECISILQDGKEEISLKYTLNGETKNLRFYAYKNVSEYLGGLSRTITYSDGQISSRADFKLDGINEEIQKEFLNPLVIAIENVAKSKTDQARIAISIVQNIPFGESNRTINFGGTTIPYFRHPYEMLYENEGVCGEKVELLAFLLREIGYGTAFFYFPDDNHEALGIKCPTEESLENTGYCFVETTAPSIITEKEIEYVGIGKLSNNFEVFLLSEGISLENNLPEYKDANKMNKIRKSISKTGRVNFFLHFANKKLNKKYGIEKQEFNP